MPGESPDKGRRVEAAIALYIVSVATALFGVVFWLWVVLTGALGGTFFTSTSFDLVLIMASAALAGFVVGGGKSFRLLWALRSQQKKT